MFLLNEDIWLNDSSFFKSHKCSSRMRTFDSMSHHLRNPLNVPSWTRTFHHLINPLNVFLERLLNVSLERQVFRRLSGARYKGWSSKVLGGTSGNGWTDQLLDAGAGTGSGGALSSNDEETSSIDLDKEELLNESKVHSVREDVCALKRPSLLQVSVEEEPW